MSYLLDTNILSEIRKGSRCDARVKRWWTQVNEADLYLSVMVMGEIRRGIEKIRIRNPEKARELDKWVQSVGKAFGPRLLAVELNVAEVWGSMTVKRNLPLVEGLLTATAIANDLTLVTRNTKDIEGTGARYLNPFEA